LSGKSDARCIFWPNDAGPVDTLEGIVPLVVKRCP
jgi:hypothetical protein